MVWAVVLTIFAILNGIWAFMPGATVPAVVHGALAGACGMAALHAWLDTPLK